MPLTLSRSSTTTLEDERPRRVRRAMRGPKLPGAPPATVKYRDVDDQIIEVDRAVVRRRILRALADGPRAKWQVREALHVAEQVVSRELQVLRRQGQVKAIGRRRTDRRWALASWRPPAAVCRSPAPTQATPFVAATPEKPRDSWWTRRELTREQFQERARRGADA